MYISNDYDSNAANLYRCDDDGNNYELPVVDAGTQTDEIMPPDSSPPKSKRGRPKKSLEESGASSKRSKLDPLLSFLYETAREMGSSFQNLLYYLGRRDAYKNGNFSEAKFYEDLLEHGIDTNFTKITPEKAMYLK